MYCSRCGTQNDDASKFCRSCGLDLSHTTPVAAVRDQQIDVTELDLVREQLKDEYEILEELGRGGMAIVFKAREKQLERDVAIKVLPFSLAFDKEFVERFQREARTSAKLEHPGIIPIYRVGKSGRVIYFVMKFLRGKPLASVLAARGSLPPGEIRQVLVQVARALAYAHKSGIVHRDIKPDNIMFDEHAQAVVTDFGIAKAATGGKLTGTGMSIGTPHYMSPEQARAQALDGRSDIYSLGVVAYQWLTGSVPFAREDSFAIGYKHIMEELPTPSLETPDKRSLFDIIRKMMAKLPDARFQNADDLVQALEGGAFAPLALATAPTRAIPSLSKLPAAPTTPLPRAGRLGAPAEHHRSVAAAGTSTSRPASTSSRCARVGISRTSGRWSCLPERRSPCGSTSRRRSKTPRAAAARATPTDRRTIRTRSVSIPGPSRSSLRSSRSPATRRSSPGRPFSCSTCPAAARRKKCACSCGPTSRRSTIRHSTSRRTCGGTRR